jgi:hypothetical protein
LNTLTECNNFRRTTKVASCQFALGGILRENRRSLSTLPHVTDVIEYTIPHVIDVIDYTLSHMPTVIEYTLPHVADVIGR